MKLIFLQTSTQVYETQNQEILSFQNLFFLQKKCFLCPPTAPAEELNGVNNVQSGINSSKLSREGVFPVYCLQTQAATNGPNVTDRTSNNVKNTGFSMGISAAKCTLYSKLQRFLNLKGTVA